MKRWLACTALVVAARPAGAELPPEAIPRLLLEGGAGYLVSSRPNQLYASRPFGYARVGAEWNLRCPALRLGATATVTSIDEKDLREPRPDGIHESARALDVELGVHAGFDPTPGLTTRLHAGLFICDFCISLAEDPRVALRAEVAYAGFSVFAEARFLVFDFAQPVQPYDAETTFAIGVGAQSTREQPRHGRYAHMTLLADGTAGLMALTSRVFIPQGVASVAVYTAGAPLVHLQRHNSDSAWKSALIRLGALAGGLVALNGSERCGDGGCRNEAPVAIWAVLAAVPTIVDAVWLARD